METYLTLGLLVSTLAFFIKWKQAQASNRNPTLYSGNRFDIDQLYLALLRLERKIDLLTPSKKDDGAVASSLTEKDAIASAPENSSPARSAPEVPEEFIAVKEVVTAANPEPSPIPPAPQLPVWEREARAILGRIWSWLLVGEEYRPKGVPLEFAMAGTWLMRLGVVVLVSCVAWFLKWSMVHGILGPSGRVGLSFAAGVALTVYGYRLMGKRYQALGQGLMGGGIATLFFAAYAAGPLYHLLPQLACFGMMALITLAGCVLAASTRSQVTAILAMLGGYATPVLLSTGSANFAGLYAYMFLLGGGILGLAIYRNWRLLHYLAFVAHWVLVLGSLRSYEPDVHFATVLPFLVLFFIQQHGVSIGYAFRRAVPISLLEAIQQFLHAGLFAALGYRLIAEAAGRPWPALLAIALGAAFVGQTLAVLKRMPSDRLSLSVSLGLAGFFTAWSVPLLFNGASLTVAWSLMALAWLWTGLRIHSRLLVLGSQVLFVLAGLRLGMVDFGRSFLDRATDATALEYLRGFSLRLVNFGAYIGSLFVAARLYRLRTDASADSKESGLRILPEADVPFAAPFRTAAVAAFLAGFAILFFVAHFEAERILGFYQPLKAPGIILVWTAFAAYFTFNARRIFAFAASGPSIVATFGGAALLLVCMRMVFYDWREMGFTLSAWRFEEAGIQFAYRLAAHAALIALIWRFGAGKSGVATTSSVARAYRTGAVTLLFLITTLETRTVFGAFLPAFQAGALSVAWSLFAMGLVAIGLRYDDRAARFTGLLMFGLVAAKVFLLDLTNLEMIWRVLSFFCVGTVLLLGSFAYLRASKPERASDGAPPEKESA